MLVGYQGIPGSNSEYAAKLLSEKLSLSEIELIPLVTSQNVVNNLLLDKINYGIMAIKNTIGGMVVETEIATEDRNIIQITDVQIPIHHCLFKKRGVSNSNIKNIASHIQALIQSKENINKLYPKWGFIETEDTAIAAKHLSEGILSDDTAVLCRKEAGYLYNLELIQENMEDRKDNFTKFGIYTTIGKGRRYKYE